MPQYLATYDLTDTRPSPYEEFIDRAAEQGWGAWIRGSDDKYGKLPNTTLRGIFFTHREAVAALRRARDATEAELGVKGIIEKWVVVEYSEAKFFSDETSEGT